jgi:hypothetical protein
MLRPKPVKKIKNLKIFSRITNARTEQKEVS